MRWQTIETQLGYFGRHRDERFSEYDQQFGRGRWRIAWARGESVLGFDGVVMLYEDAYFAYLALRPALLEEFVATASDVYDNERSNLTSGLDYSKQEGSRTHLQDIALRRCVIRFGREFAGSRLIQIRDQDAKPPVHPLSLTLSPGRVPFHRPEWIRQPELIGWWQPGSVESFYQSGKLLQRWVPS